MKDHHMLRRLKNRDKNQQTLKRQDLVKFKRNLLSQILSIDIRNLETKLGIEKHAKLIFENILASSYLTE